MRTTAVLLNVLLLPVLTAFSAEPHRPLDTPDAWRQVGGSEDSFKFRDGRLYLRWGDAEPSAILTKAEYENFELSFRIRYHEWAAGGLYIHAPWNGAFRAGLEIELADHHGDAPSAYRAGAIYRRVPPVKVAMNEHGEWNDVRVHMDWPHLKVWINDTVVQNTDLSNTPQTAHTLRRGAIGFQNGHGWGMEVRDLEITPLPDTEGGIALLENGIQDWEEVRPKSAKWTFEDDTLINHGGYGYLQYPKDVQDFDLHMYYRCLPGAANGGVFFRWLADDSDRGNEIQLLDMPGALYMSGSIYKFQRADDRWLTPGEWTLLQIKVRGPECTTWLNGHPAAHTTDLTKIRPGRITLQAHRDNARIEYRNIVLVPRDEP